MILIWREDSDPTVNTTGDLDTYVELATDSRFIPENCEPAPRPFPASTVNITSRVEPADFFYAGPVPMVSAELRSLLERFNVKAEFIEVSATHRGKPYTRKQFYYFNLLNAVECFDFERSEYTMTEYGAAGIEELVLDETKADGHHLFRIGQITSARSNPKAVNDIIYCASDELATAVITSGLTGVVFVTPEHLDSYPPRNVAWVPPT